MFRNPQDALPIPPRANLERYRKLTAALVKACKSGDAEVLGKWAEQWVNNVAEKTDLVFTRRRPFAISRWIQQVRDFAQRTLPNANGRCRLADAQLVIAQSHGFESWSRFSKHLNGLAQKSSAVARFESAADAIVSGNLAKLKRLLREDRRLVRARSTRRHAATLLHYVSANGVENYRQKTPKNIVAIAEVLLNAGVEVDAEANVYGGGATTLGLVATSIHPYRVGMQNELMELLLNHGAEVDHCTSAGNRQSSVMGALANGCPEAAQYLAARGARLSLEAAAGVGRLDVVKRFFNDIGSRKTKTSRKQVQSAFLTACGWGRNDVVEFLLDKGVDLNGGGGDGQTPLHCAVITGQLDTVKLLLKMSPPLEARNIYGGTVLGQTLWSAAHGGDAKLYSEIIETLIAAGAKLPPRHVPVNKPIDDLLRQYGSEPEPTWYWYGEKPA
ncbi:MAG: ankyrin repeat domain-containing protein [Pyrinomonadaceae bacterium]